MKQVCPNADVWHDIHKKLEVFARTNLCIPPQPPVPLILAGWAYTNDHDKKHRWQETVEWAKLNSCYEIIKEIKAEDFYCVESISSHHVGPEYDLM